MLTKKSIILSHTSKSSTTPTATSPTPSTDTPPSKPEDKSTEDKVDVNSAKIVDVIKNPKKYGIDPATDEVFKKKSQYGFTEKFNDSF